MLGMGLSLTTAQIIQPLKNVRLVILALLANFVLVPLLAFGITRLIPMDQSLQIGLIVLSTVAGAPFLVKEVQAAKGDLALAVGLMFMMMVVTILYVPLVLPLLLPGSRSESLGYRQVPDRDHACSHHIGSGLPGQLAGGCPALVGCDE